MSKFLFVFLILSTATSFGLGAVDCVKKVKAQNQLGSDSCLEKSKRSRS